MFARCILHLGLRRTGNGAIHAMLERNREALLAQDIYLPLLQDSADLPALALYAKGEGAPDHPQARALAGRAGDHGAFRAGLEKWVDGLLSRAGGGTRTVVLSSPTVVDVVEGPEGFERLRALTSRIARETTILVFLRRQDHVVVSLAAAAIRAGAGIGTPLLPDLTDGLPYAWRYGDIVTDLARVFGRDALIVRVIAGAAAGGDAAAGFCAALDIRTGPGWWMPPRVGRALTLPAQLFLARLNDELPDAAARAGAATRLADLPGPRRLPTRDRARRFVEAFAAQNDAALARIGGGRERLFDQDFAEHPESALDQLLTVQEAVRIAARLWAARDDGPVAA